ncbi:NUDIX hydrolase [Salinithrix halophila]|uniref:NUDIX hydrolase n=1 Tax=Salinithrix halophila TaxID=1485204 RepID=A0ABV8JFL8_9BACL
MIKVDRIDFQRLDVVYTLIVDSYQRVLMVQNKDSWSLPGGKREKGETLIEAAIRETKEETGFNAKIEGIVNVNECLDRFHVFFVTFKGWIVDGKKESVNDLEIQCVDWKNINQAQQLMPWYGDLQQLLLNRARYHLES